MAVAVGQLPDLNSDYTVSPGQVSQYRTDGHTILRSVASREEIKAYRPVIGRVMLQLLP
jgi:hypothetical protein